MKCRIIAGMGANTFGMAITIVIQLISLPLFLHYWGTSTYGVWLMLSAIPAYLSMADVGMVTASGNKMTMAMGKGDLRETNKIFQSAQLFMGIVCGSLALLIVPLILWIPFPGLVTLDRQVALIALVFGVLLSLIGGLTEAVFKSTQRYATGTMLSNYVRLGEWLGQMVSLIIGGSFAVVALSGLVVRLIGSIIGMVLATRGVHGLRWGISASNRDEIRVMLKPALSFMAFPLANALSFQGLTLLVGATFGPISVALFNTYRTIARISVQVTAIFSHALWPEFSRLFGQNSVEVIEKLFRRTSSLGAVQALFLSIALYFISPWLLEIWTHGAIQYIPSLMFLILLYAAVSGIWHIPRVLLMATNQHSILACWSLVSGFFSIVLAWIFGRLFDLNGVVVAMLVSEIFIAIICTWLAYRAIANSINKKDLTL